MNWLHELMDDGRVRHQRCGTALPDWTVTQREMNAGALHVPQPKLRRLHVKRKLRRRKKVQA